MTTDELQKRLTRAESERDYCERKLDELSDALIQALTENERLRRRLSAERPSEAV